MATRKDIFNQLKNWNPKLWVTSSYCNCLIGSYEAYNEILATLDDSEKPVNWDSILERIKSVQDMIMESSRLYYQGMPSKAFTKLSEAIDIIPLPFSQVPANSNFYRMRIIKDEDMRSINYEKMFHIPLNKRELVRTERFSAPGYPCLYIGNSSYVCWEEMGRPSLSSCMVSRLTNRLPLKVLDLSFSCFDEWNDNFEKRIVADALILASIIKRSPKDANYKDEYSIPQGIMEWIITHNYTENQFSKDEPDYIFGVKYVSVHKNDQFKFPENKFINIAIPVIQSDSDFYCQVLTAAFSITNPTCAEWEQLLQRDRQIPKNANYSSLSEEEQRDIIYHSSLFGIIEHSLEHASPNNI